MEEGFIKLHRSILKWEWFQDDKTFKVFIYLLLNANWEDSRYRGQEIPRGSVVTGLNSLSKNLGISVKSVRTALNHLKSTGEVTIKTTNKFSIVTIVNWEKYQGFNVEVANKKANELADKGQTKGKQRATYKEYKNIRNKEYKNSNPKPRGCYTEDFFRELEEEVRSKAKNG